MHAKIQTSCGSERKIIYNRIVSSFVIFNLPSCNTYVLQDKTLCQFLIVMVVITQTQTTPLLHDKLNAY